MTRENKLALVTGFGLLLFVGILVSDHLAARPLPPAVETAWTGLEPPGPASDAIFISVRRDERPQELVFETVGIDDLAITVPAVDPFDDLPVLPVGVPERTHTVQAGDNFTKIAGLTYGRKALGAKLAEYNGMKPEALRVGDTVRLPPIATLDPSAVEPARVAAAVPADPVLRPRAVERSYRVKEGDTFYRIASRELGDPGRFRELERINGVKASNLRPGMTIRLPGGNDA